MLRSSSARWANGATHEVAVVEVAIGARPSAATHPGLQTSERARRRQALEDQAEGAGWRDDGPMSRVDQRHQRRLRVKSAVAGTGEHHPRDETDRGVAGWEHIRPRVE